MVTQQDYKPINIESPIGKMPFGKHKGEIIWTIGHGPLEWMTSNMNLSDRTKQTFQSAREMFNKSGQWAVLRKHTHDKWYVKLIDILPTEATANAIAQKANDTYQDFVYHIVNQ